MGSDKKRVLIIDGDSTQRSRVARLLDTEYITCESPTAQDGLESKFAFRPDCILLDSRIFDAESLEPVVQLSGEATPLILLTGPGEDNLAIDAIKAGAESYLPKTGLCRERLVFFLERVIERVTVRQQLVDLRSDLKNLATTAFDDIHSPLATIVGFCKAISRDNIEAMSPRQLMLLKKAEELASESSVFVENLIEHLRAGQSEAPISPVDLPQAVGSNAWSQRDRTGTCDLP